MQDYCRDYDNEYAGSRTKGMHEILSIDRNINTYRQRGQRMSVEKKNRRCQSGVTMVPRLRY